MAKVVRLSARPPSAEGVDALAAQLSRAEQALSSDPSTMDAIAAAEQRLVGALARARSDTLSEVAQKVAAVVRRATAADGFLPRPDLELLSSALADLQRIDQATAVA